ncbi:sensor histidine kinase [Taibaiella helva]|uniref:sensor histidine kinase n=1 Tax=Taibaiella helva TaxID=2301235 RepID=UPI000E58FD3D|nr:sensor histidine kinase [Taibaiella helva]
MPKRPNEKPIKNNQRANTTYTSPPGIALVHIDKYFSVIHANAAAADIWKIAGGTLIDEHFIETHGSGWSSEQKQWLQDVIRNNTFTPLDLPAEGSNLTTYRLDDGSYLLLYIFHETSSSDLSASNELLRRAAFLEEQLVTARQKLQVLVQQQEQEITRAVTAMQEQERRRIAEHLHTEIGQQLSAIQMQLEHLSLSEIRKMLNSTILKVRQVSFELMPVVLKDFGLETALRDMIGRSLTERNIRCTFDFRLLTTLNSDTQLVLFRMAQELINNIVRHANATSVSISLRESGEGIHLVVQDNGTGTDTEALQNGFGLLSIENRVKTMNGTFSLSSPVKTGTKAEIFFPLPSAD